jgi:glutamine amidotransferase
VSRSATITIVDYGMGNIGSVCAALDQLGARHLVSNRRADLRDVAGIVLPGVGAFRAAMESLRALDLVDELHEQVIGRETPFLGICLGMQLLAQDSVEGGFATGLGWIDGHVLAMQPAGSLRVPHVGWNALEPRQPSVLFDRLDDDAHFYFDHSYHLQCDAGLVAAHCHYGESYVAAIQKAHILGVQFHPEKSQRNGLKLLRGFLNFTQRAA